VEQRGGIYFVNPGSAGPRRFSLPVTVGFLRIGENGIEACITNLDV
jgi:predicted phosphodiesterase